MGNKFPIISVLMLVICLPAAIYISSSKIAPARKEMYKGREKQLERVYLPVAGIDKFYADAQWVKLVQEMAGQNTVPSDKEGKRPSAEEEKKLRFKQMEYFYNQFNRLSDLDPNNTQYYLFGARFLQNDRPKDAMDLLSKGDTLLKDPTWELPQLQYHIVRNIMVGFDNPEGEKEHLDEMSSLLKKAMDRPNAPAHMQTKWLNLQAKKNGFGNDDIGRLQLWAKYYLDKIRPVIPTDMNTPDASGIPARPDANLIASESGMGFDAGLESGLRDTIMKMAQRMALENWQKQQKAADAKQKAALAKTHKIIADIFFKIAPEGHYSPISLLSYEAGDLYDTATGTQVVPFGVDPDMLQKGVVVLYKGDYSQATGKPRVPDEEIARRFKAGELKIPAVAK